MLNQESSDERVQAECGTVLVDPVAEKNVRTQVVFREVNERIAQLIGQWGRTDVGLFICECSAEECAEALEMSPAEYERVRRHGARFIVCAGHQLPELERVVEENGRFLVVEKVGPAAAIARASDSREKRL